MTYKHDSYRDCRHMCPHAHAVRCPRDTDDLEFSDSYFIEACEKEEEPLTFEIIDEINETLSDIDETSFKFDLINAIEIGVRNAVFERLRLKN